MGYLVVVAPLKAEMAERVRELLADGPPFDLDDSVFERHAVHLTDHEVVFVFEGEGSSSTLVLSAENPELWRAAKAWQECFSERPRVARTGYSWERSNLSPEISFEPTPGPGDSEGGDIFPPYRRAVEGSAPDRK
jgi:hypothetical protein